MNKTIIKNILIFAAGVGAGAGSTFMYFKNKYEQIANEEIASVRDNAARTPIIRTVINNLNEEKKSKVRLVDFHRNMSNNYGGDSIPTNAGLDPAELEHPQDEEDEYRQHERMSMDANRSEYPAPYIISLEEFTEGETHFDKPTLYYYDVDEALTEEDESLIDDPDGLVGLANLTQFGDMSDGDPDCIYVRNERLAVDFEIIRLPKSYVEMTLKRRDE